MYSKTKQLTIFAILFSSSFGLRLTAQENSALALACLSYCERKVPKEFNTYDFKIKSYRGNSVGTAVISNEIVLVNLEVEWPQPHINATKALPLRLCIGKSDVVVAYDSLRRSELFEVSNLADIPSYASPEFAFLPQFGWTQLLKHDITDWMAGGSAFPAANSYVYTSLDQERISCKRRSTGQGGLEIIFSSRFGAPISFQNFKEDGTKGALSGVYEWRLEGHGTLLQRSAEFEISETGKLLRRSLEVDNYRLTTAAFNSTEQFLQSLPIGYRVTKKDVYNAGVDTYFIGGLNGQVTSILQDLADEARTYLESAGTP